jgi:hypothetical protein
MNINISIDIEDEIRKALSPYVTVYCRPLPKNLALPSVEVRKIGGSETNTIDTFMVMLYARAKEDAEADELIRKAVGILKTVSKEQTCAIRDIQINAGGSWTEDPVRPDLAMCSTTLMVVAHTEDINI